MLESEFKYFLDHHAELLEKYPNKYVVIKGETVLGAYASQLEAYNESKKSHKLGTFLIQLVTPGKEAYSHTYHSRVSFA